MSRLIFTFIILFIGLSSASSQFGRIYPRKYESITLKKDIMGYESSPSYLVDSSFYFALSSGISMLTITDEGNVSVLDLPGAGYGCRWKPDWYSGEYLLGFDLFMNTSYSKDDGYVSVVVSPVVWCVDYVGFAYGIETRIHSKKEVDISFRFGLVVGITL